MPPMTRICRLDQVRPAAARAGMDLTAEKRAFNERAEAISPQRAMAAAR